MERCEVDDDEIKEILSDVNAKIGKSYTSMDELIEDRKQARAEKNWDLADKIRIALDEKGIILKDSKEGTTWEVS